MLIDDSLEDGTPILSELDKVVKKVEKNVVTDFDKKYILVCTFFVVLTALILMR